MTKLLKRLLPIVIFVIALLFIWTWLYWFLGKSSGTNWSLFDCFYMTIVHMAPRAVYEALPNLGVAGRFLTLALLFIGLGSMVYIVSNITSFIIEGRFSEHYRRRAMLKQIAKLRGHYIVCGANQIAQKIISEFLQREVNFVVLESNHDILQEALSLGKFFYTEVDPTKDEDLVAAGIKVARGIVIATPSDETNLYITFAARELNPAIRIVSRVSEATSAARIIRAGAHSVINPDYIGGLRMVSETLRPTVVSFLDIMMRDTQSAFRIDECTIQKDCGMENKTLEEAQIGKHTGALVLAVRKPGQDKFIYNPPGDTILEAGTTVVVLADLQQIKKFKQFANEAEELVRPGIE